MFFRIRKLFVCLLAMLSLSSCDSGFQTIESGENAVVFVALPSFMGGGVKDKVLQPGEREFIFPWETLYRIDTSLQSITWDRAGAGDRPQQNDLVETRSLDGNEVGLAMTVQYRVNPELLPRVIQKVGLNNEKIRTLVSVVARSDIRTHMNVLKTPEFFNQIKRETAVADVQRAMEIKLAPEGIIIDKVIYLDHQFERRLVDGRIDRSYQEQIDQTQTVNQEKQQEEKKIFTVVEQKRREFNDEKAKVNRVVEEADGYKRQATIRGQGYLAAKKNEAEQILTLGNAEVEGLRKKVAALSGPGGKALLRLSLVQALLAKNPRFVLLNSGGKVGDGAGNSAGIDLTRIDANELLKQAGVIATAAEVTSEISKPAKDDANATKLPAQSTLQSP